jgi:hypothetical protein
MSLFSSLNILINILWRSLGFHLIHSHWSHYCEISNFWRSCGPLDFHVTYITVLSCIHLGLLHCLEFLTAVFFQLNHFSVRECLGYGSMEVHTLEVIFSVQELKVPGATSILLPQ